MYIRSTWALSRLALPLFLFFSTSLFAQEESAEAVNTAETLNQAEAANPTEVLNDEQQQFMAWATEFLQQLNPQSGKIELPQGAATLNVPADKFYYLNSEEAEKVLVEAWGNPPGQKTLGMLFPTGMTPLDQDAWAVTIEYEEDGYVSDDDAEEIDYDELLTQMKADTREASKERVKMNYESIELVGWAEPPYYDKASHKLYWAKEIKFGQIEENTLNYNIRILGRKGVLVLNFIAGINQKELINSNLNEVLAIAEFNDGARYEDFNPDVDKVAAYGLGALVAGKVISKTGFLAIALVFLKKFWVFIFIGIGALFKMIFGRGKKES